MIQENPKKSAFDPSKYFVHITNVRPDGFIEFDFSIGEPEMYVELVLPWKAFEEFCAHNSVNHLTAEEVAAVEYDRLKWRYGKPGVTN